jgi:hypothetical protein
MWITGRYRDDEIVGSVLGLPTLLACIIVVLLMGVGLWFFQPPSPRPSRTWFVDLEPGTAGWSIKPCSADSDLPPLGAGAARVRVDVRERLEGGRRMPPMSCEHEARLSLDSLSPTTDRDQALDAMQQNWAGIAAAAGAAWPNHALERAIVARGMPVYTVEWLGVLQSVALFAGIGLLFVVAAAGRRSLQRAGT